MGKVLLYIASSLDGLIARENGDISWLDSFNSPNEDYGYTALKKKTGALVMGARTYEKMLSFGEWPEDKNNPTYVVSKKQLEGVKGVNIIFWRKGSLAKLASQIKKSTKKDVWLVGGAKLAQGFLKEKLVDEIILSIIPVVLGNGISLFGEAGKETSLKLLKEKAYANGIVQLHYKVLK